MDLLRTRVTKCFGGSALLVFSSPVPGEYNKFQMPVQPKDGPQYPAQEGAKISGDPAQDVASQGVLGGRATCDRPERSSSPGSLGRSATGESTAAMPFTASTPEQRAAPEEGPSTLVPVGPKGAAPEEGSSLTVPVGLKPRSRKTGKQGSKARMPTGAQSSVVDTASRRVPSSSDSEAVMTDIVSHVGSEEEEMLLASPSEEEAAEAGTASSAPAERDTSKTVGTSTGKKRKTEAGPTPPQKMKKKKKGGPPLGGSFRQAEQDNLLGVVLVEGHPYTVLTKTQLNYLREKLMEHLDASIASRSVHIPRFKESGVRQGRFHLSCADARTYEWLTVTIGNTTVPSGETDDYHLRLVTPAEVPKLLRAEVYLTGTPPSIPTFCMRLRAQNSGLHTDRWRLRHQQSTDHGLLMVWSIDKESADALAAVDDRPYYGLGCVSFRVARGPDPGGTSQ